MQNAKLWKRILNEGIDPRSYRNHKELADSILCLPLIVDTRPKEAMRSIASMDFPSVVFPFDNFMVESTGEEEQPDGSIREGQMGAAIFSSVQPDGIRTVNFYALGCGPSHMPCMFCRSRFSVDAKGHVIGEKIDIIESNLIQKSARDVTVVAVSAALDTLLLLTCKNISLSPRDNDPKQVRKAVKRHGGKPEDYRYHVLVVRPPGAKAGDTSQEQEIGVMPRHVCRGHFSEYGPEFGKGLLFGKYAGRFYIPPHLKGDKKNGTVEKDYEIRP